jgi:hypothetical protein
MPFETIVHEWYAREQRAKKSFPQVELSSSPKIGQ